MKTSSLGDKLTVLSQHVFHLHVLDDHTKKKIHEIICRVWKSWCGTVGFFLKLIVNPKYMFHIR